MNNYDPRKLLGSRVLTNILITFLIAFFATIILAGCTTTERTQTAMVQQVEAEIPAPTGYVVDQSDVLSPAKEQELADKLKAFDAKAQIAVVTIPTTGSLDEEQYAIKLGEKWGVGHDGEDNGIIFLVVTGDRKLRIEVGRGLEDEITDSEAGRILDNHVVPELKNKNWEAGITNGVDAIMKEIK